MVLAGNNAKCLLSVNHTTKTIHHNHYHSSNRQKMNGFSFQQAAIFELIFVLTQRNNFS